MVTSLILLIIGNLSKGSELHPSPFFPKCSTISFIIFFICLFVDVLIGFSKFQDLKKSENLSNKKAISFGLISFVAGTITSFGISGSLIFATGLYFMKFTPGTLTSITRLSLFSSSLAAVL